MKCALRREEILQILSAHFRSEVEDFIIVPSTPSSLGLRLRNKVNNAAQKSYLVSNVRLLREVATDIGKHITVMEGKWAIENWDRFLEFIDEYNRLPLSGFASGDQKGILK